MKLRLLALLLLSVSLEAQTPGLSDAQVITARAFQDGRGMRYLTELTDRFGPRLTGSPNYTAAAAWAVDQFRAMGIRDVRLEPVQLPHTWTRGEGRGRILAPDARPLHVEALGWTPATPPGGVTGTVYLLGNVSPAYLAAHAADMRDRVVLLDPSQIVTPDSYRGWAELFTAPEALLRAGVRGVLIAGSRQSQVLGTTSLDWNAGIEPLPMAYIGMEDAQYIIRKVKSEPVTVEYSYTVTIGGPTTVPNVVAEIKGSERPDEWILLGAHFDSWDLATGAQDNGAGAAQVLEAARILSSLDARPRRTVRFALWTGEEEGLLGSRAYVKQHAAELPKCVMVLNTDNGAGDVQGWKTQGRDDLEKALQPFMDQFLLPLGAGQVSKEVTYDTDHGPFVSAGVPALDMLVDMKAYMEVHHTAGDTIDKVLPINLNTGTAVLAITARHLANADQPLGPHLDRPAIEKIFKPRDIDVLLRAIGEW